MCVTFRRAACKQGRISHLRGRKDNIALGINSYNDVFRNFAEFAQKSLEAGDEKAIATVGEQQTGDGRKILTVANSFSDRLKNWNTWTRRGDAKSANDFARQLFRDSVANMFGGESKITESVKKAMVLGDYNSGKPLTARQRPKSACREGRS